MSFKFIGARLKALILIVIGAFRRALCCFRRKRRYSNSEAEQLTGIGVVPGYTTANSKADQDWRAWDDKPVTVQDHIERYRQQKVAPESVPEQPQDFFQDMTPQFTRQTKVLIGNRNNRNSPDLSRLAVNTDVLPAGSELEIWDESENAWEGDENALELIREQRRQERREKALRSQTQKVDHRPTGLGARLAVS